MENYLIEPMTSRAAKQICGWEYEPPYNVYNYMPYEEAVSGNAAVTQADRAEDYLCFWQGEILAAYTSIILRDEKIFVGIGVAPWLCGRGLSSFCLNKTVAQAKIRYPDSEFWVQVRSWNERAVKCYRKSGFAEKYRKIIRDRFDENTEFIFMRYESDVSFSYLVKAEFSGVARRIFDILADNMSRIAPTGNTREEDFVCWYEGVSDGLKRYERQIVLIRESDEIIGFFQYYTNAETFMMEEIQLKPEYHGTNVFRALYGFLIENISGDMVYTEAYANTANSKSAAILEHLGLSKIGMNKNGKSYHFRGLYADLVKWYKKGMEE